MANNALTKKLLICTGVVSIFLIASLIFALLAQWRYKYKSMADIDTFFRQYYYAKYDYYKTQIDFDTEWKQQIEGMHKARKENNDKRKDCVIVSMCLFFVSIFVVILSALVLILLSS